MSHIEVIARGVCIQHNKVLLCRHIKQGYNYLPGGHVEFGESAARALAREMIEETGAEVRVGACLLVTEGVFDSRKKSHHELNVVFHMELVRDEPVESLEPNIAFDWVDLASIVDTDIRPDSAKAWLAALHQPTPTQWVSEIS